jgi:2-keto-4-pentenoate hydratase/2-oxohepta-3-ene-1,7-dioic acid hydratase in catechol pathway
MTYSLATYRLDVPTPVLLVDGAAYRIADVAPEVLEPTPARGLMSVFDRWSETEPVLQAAAEAIADGEAPTPVPHPAVEEDVLTPLQYPNKVIGVGANYYDHMKADAGHLDWDKNTKIPVMFFKPPTTTLVGQGRSVSYPQHVAKFDYEMELAYVVGKRGRKIPATEAMDHVAGYTLALDMSARDMQRNPKHLVGFDLFSGKGFDDSCPLGPAITPARFVDPENLQIQFWRNGELKQKASTKDMIWSIPEQIEYISNQITLEPGDVVLTGTPSGVGLATGSWTKVGDSLEGTITGLGTIHVEIVDADD